MRLLKISFLLLLTLGAMRLVHWSLWKVLTKIPRVTRAAAAVAASAICLAGFVSLLFVGLEKGEPVDPNAIVFGAAVFTIFAMVDIWRARRLRAAAKAEVAAGSTE